LVGRIINRNIKGIRYCSLENLISNLLWVLSQSSKDRHFYCIAKELKLDEADEAARIAKELKLVEADEAAYIIYEQFEQQQLEAQQLKDILDEADEAVRILAANGQAHLNGGYCQGVIKRI
jgi:hypothetical protein